MSVLLFVLSKEFSWSFSWEWCLCFVILFVFQTVGLGEAVMYCGLRGVFLWACPLSGLCESGIFGVKAVLSVGACCVFHRRAVWGSEPCWMLRGPSPQITMICGCHGPVRGSLLRSCWSRYPRTVSELPWEEMGEETPGFPRRSCPPWSELCDVAVTRVRADSTLLLALSLALPQPWKFRQVALVSLRHCSHKATSAGPRAQIWCQDCWTLPEAASQPRHAGSASECTRPQNLQPSSYLPACLKALKSTDPTAIRTLRF